MPRLTSRLPNLSKSWLVPRFACGDCEPGYPLLAMRVLLVCRCLSELHLSRVTRRNDASSAVVRRKRLIGLRQIHLRWRPRRRRTPQTAADLCSPLGAFPWVPSMDKGRASGVALLVADACIATKGPGFVTWRGSSFAGVGAPRWGARWFDVGSHESEVVDGHRLLPKQPPMDGAGE